MKLSSRSSVCTPRSSKPFGAPMLFSRDRRLCDAARKDCSLRRKVINRTIASMPAGLSVAFMAAAQAVDARYDGLRQLLSQQLQSLPPGAGALLGEALKVNDRERDEMTWICSAGPGLLTRYAPGDFRVNLRLRPHDSKGTQLDLGVLRKPKDDPVSSNAHESWVRLIDDVTNLQIRYFDPRLNAWVQSWTDTITLPRLVRLIIGRRDAKVPEEIVVPLARTSL